MALPKGPYRVLVLSLVRQRKKLGLTQADVDAMVGWTDRYCSKLECGERTAKLLTLIDWVNALDAELVMRRRPRRKDLASADVQHAPGQSA